MSAYNFHVTRAARQRYGLQKGLFSTTGNVVFLDLYGARLFSQRMNDVRRTAGAPAESLVRPGDMNAMGLIDEILHFVVGLFRDRLAPDVFTRAWGSLEVQMGAKRLDTALRRFAEEFPGPDESPQDVRREVALEEMLLLSLANANPAFAPFAELFDESVLSDTAYAQIIDGLSVFFATEPVFGPDNQTLVEMLKSPVRAAPTSLSGQLEYIRTRWASLLGDLLLRLLTGLDMIREDGKLGFGGFTPGPPEVYEYAGQEREVEAFSADRDWMPRVVMVAKNALVWLDQLSKRSGTEVSRLDQIPDSELARLASAGVTALWLIGVWERSPASREIKRRMGNTGAEASAYSLFDYDVAAELGGEQSLDDLRRRAWGFGIRLASDMVPNHTGIDSRWMAEHPERFLGWQHPMPPFPSYTFNGPDLSTTPGIGIHIEDHYWDRSDAAVVFRRVDRTTGETRLIYHGNDGTHMPWNDTAQLDFLNPATREAVIQTILRVARRFPIIRFDAAMTLTKKHFQRLWYPEPGRGGDIPSRAGNGMTRHDFDKAMPVEFWREVVDRVAREAPDTLLLAEAFWLLEGFFVRTLGMHRVYNSAFMHMLKDEDNAGYRQTMRNTLEFDPQVLKRFVNFMSNPDEQTAIEQFGDGDKYFGVCTLMATLPGLPMFAHGQLEGLREKYGMEFRRAAWDEHPNEALMARHEREIYPLLRRRHLFSGVESFLLYDFFTPEGGVNENVFAYSNGVGAERGLVLYNNRFAEARGWIRMSAAYAARTPEGMQLTQKCLGEGLALPNDAAAFVIFLEQKTGLQYIRSCRGIWENGMYAELHGFGCQTFLDFTVVRDEGSGRWSGLAAELDGRGVPSIDVALREREYRSVRAPFADLLRAASTEAFTRFIAAADARVPGVIDRTGSQRAFATSVRKPKIGTAAHSPVADAFIAVMHVLDSVRPAALSPSAEEWVARLLAWLDEWMLRPLVVDFLATAGWDRASAETYPALVELSFRLSAAGAVTWKAVLSDPATAVFLRVNTYDGIRWLRKESLDALAAVVPALARRRGKRPPAAARIVEAAAATGYRWDELLAAVTKPKTRGRSS